MEHMAPWLPISCLGLWFGALAAIGAEPVVESSQLPRVPPTEPGAALSTFRTKPGFRLERVASEPMVVDPIAISFDEDGRCYVVEMRDYSERRPERLGRIRRLEDTDGDGRFDTSTEFAKDLPWPTAVICWDGGVLVGATPDIIYFKDTSGDGVADVRETIFTGFAADFAPFATNKLNVQALMNSFNWSLGNRIHGATSFNGGRVTRVDSPFVREWLKRAGRATGTATASAPLDLRGRDFSFDPRTLEMRAESGGGQYGMSFDSLGRKYVCSNSSHLQTLMYEERYAGRNSFHSMPRSLVDIAVDGGPAPVFRISADEPWRVVRTRWRVAGLVSGPVEGGGRPSGYFTGATGVTIYRGDAFGPEFVGNAFVGDAGGNLVHRKLILPDGASVKGTRPADEEKVEFLASTDNWFRPVQMANAPDGCLYICDMYREVIEHPWSLPDSIKKHLDLNSGNDRGRIYRVVPEGFKARPQPRLSKASTFDLVKLLEHPNGWHRDTASRLLFERQDKTAIPGLIQTLAASTSAVARLHALHALVSLGPVNEPTVLMALNDPDDGVRRAGIRLAEDFLASPSSALWKKMTGSVFPSVPAVRLQLALSLGETRDPRRLDVLARLAEDRDSWIRTAVLNSLNDDAGKLFEKLYGKQMQRTYREGTDFLLQLVHMIGARGQTSEVEGIVDFALTPVRPPADAVRDAGFVQDLDLQVVASLNEGLQSGPRRLADLVPDAKVESLLARARTVAGDVGMPLTNRIVAISVLGSVNYPRAAPSLLPLLGASHPSPIQSAALRALDRFPASELSDEVIQRWPSFAPAIKSEALSMLLKRPQRASSLLAAIEKGVVNRTELSAAQQAQLRSHRDKALRQRAEEVLGRAPIANRQSVVETFRSALDLRGTAANGRKLFEVRCATCHRLGNDGHALGPDFATVKSGGKEKILVNILDPNREVNSNYLAYSVETKDGESFSGLIANENANSVTLRMAGGIETSVARGNIASMQRQGKSIMPEGLEEGWAVQDLADLLAFILDTP